LAQKYFNLDDQSEMLDPLDPNWPLWRRAQAFDPYDDAEYDALKKLLPEPPQTPDTEEESTLGSSADGTARQVAFDTVMSSLKANDEIDMVRGGGAVPKKKKKKRRIAVVCDPISPPPGLPEANADILDLPGSVVQKKKKRSVAC
jgi:hypothetical protein